MKKFSHVGASAEYWIMERNKIIVRHITWSSFSPKSLQERWYENMKRCEAVVLWLFLSANCHALWALVPKKPTPNHHGTWRQIKPRYVDTGCHQIAGDQHGKQVKRKIQVALVVLSWRLVWLILRACCGMEAQNNIQHDRYLPNFDQTIQNRCHVWTMGHWYTTNQWLWSRILYWLFGSCWIVQDTFALIICQV